MRGAVEEEGAYEEDGLRYKNDRFEMHDQIRDMGKMVVKEEQLTDPLTYSRPWSKDQILEVLKNAEASLGNPHVHGVDFLGISGERIKMSWKVIGAMPRLRFITGATRDAFEDEGDMVRLPGNMRWFSWSGCPYRTLTFHNSLHERLCVLHLSDGHFQHLGSQSMVFPKLKVLDLSGCCSLIRTLDFTHLPSLVKLVLDKCSSLVEIDESIRHLKKLAKLSMKECVELKGLPVELCKLTSLEFLDFGDCEQISVLPKQIGDLKSLKYLGLDNTSISEIPDSIGRLQSLERLDLSYCSSLRKMPDSIGVLKREDDHELKLNGLNSLRKLPDSLGDMKSMRRLSLRDCKSLQEIPDIIVKKVPDFICKMKNLKELHLREIKEISGLIGGLLRLEKMCIKKFPSVSNLNGLRMLLLGGCKALSDLCGLGSLNSLEELILTASDGLSFDLMDKLSQNSFEQLEFLFISGVMDGSNLLFRLPKGGQLNGLGGVFSLTEEPPSSASHVIFSVQLMVEGKIVTEGRWEAEKVEEVYFKKALDNLGVEGKVLYAIEFGKEEEIFRYVKEGQATLMVRTTYNDYQLKMAYFDLIC
ncbi:TMV resistance protein [Nymphaea thermarum]|nr:TMV resistance protein [Nymphaea thermarum]